MTKKDDGPYVIGLTIILIFVLWACLADAAPGPPFYCEHNMDRNNCAECTGPITYASASPPSGEDEKNGYHRVPPTRTMPPDPCDDPPYTFKIRRLASSMLLLTAAGHTFQGAYRYDGDHFGTLPITGEHAVLGRADSLHVVQGKMIQSGWPQGTPYIVMMVDSIQYAVPWWYGTKGGE
jgi:hypothetical protein